MSRADFAARFARCPCFLTEGAVGGRLVHEHGLPPDPHVDFAGMLYSDLGRGAVASIHAQYLSIARESGLPMLVMGNTRRANEERVAKGAFAGRDIPGDWVRYLRGLAASSGAEAYVGCIVGCKGDAYRGDQGLTRDKAADFHAWQIREIAGAEPDYLFAGIMPCLEEAIGMAGAIAQTGLPYIISFMIDRSGRLLDGTPIAAAIEAIDGAVSRQPLAYMCNCVHPNVLRYALSAPENSHEILKGRFAGLQANAADGNPRELDGTETLVSSAPQAWMRAFMKLHDRFPQKVVGGCCGTDERHIRALAAWRGAGGA